MMDTTNCSGRLGNRFFQNMVVDMIARMYNLPANYGYSEIFKKLGFNFFTGSNQFELTILLTDENINYVLDGQTSGVNIILSDVYFQNPETAKRIRENINKETIKNNNIFANRYNNNNDVYIHVRLGDLQDRNLTPGFDYYDKVLSSISFENGFISTDSINDPLIERLVNKYKLNILLTDEVQTIQFGSTCKYIVTAGGTFSWMIAVLGFYSTIFYPKDFLTWHGNIYVFPDWNGY